MLFKTREDFISLNPGQRIYKVGTSISGYFYAGFSPVNTLHVILIDDQNISKAEILYLKKDSSDTHHSRNTIWTDDYEEGKKFMWLKLINQMENIKDIYFKNWSEQDWREFKLNTIL